MLGAVVGPLHVTTHRPTRASVVQLVCWHDTSASVQTVAAAGSVGARSIHTVQFCTSIIDSYPLLRPFFHASITDQCRQIADTVE